MRIVFAFALAASFVFAQQGASNHDMAIVVGKGELIQFEHDIQRVVISEPKIADAVVVSPREVMVNAKGVGKGKLIVWETGLGPARYNIAVLPDSSDFDQFRKDIQASIPESNLTVTGNNETLVLTGMVKDPGESKRAAALASTRAKTVVNLLQMPPPIEPRQILLQVKFAAIDRVALAELGFNFFSTNSKGIGGV